MRIMKPSVIILLLSILFPFTLHAVDINPPMRGYFQTVNVDKCWYKTSLTKGKYFSPLDEDDHQVHVHVFENPKCMTNDDMSKMMIANVITRFYKNTKFQKDTKFMTHPRDWKKASGDQKRGYSIHSKNYPLPKVWIDFKLSRNNKYILKAIHTDGM